MTEEGAMPTFEVGDRVNPKEWHDPGIIYQIKENEAGQLLWVLTSCNVYRAWDAEIFDRFEGNENEGMFEDLAVQVKKGWK